MSARPLHLALAVAALAAGCDSPSSDVGTGPPAKVEILSGTGQTGTAGERLEAALVVRVTDARGRPVHQQRVEFVASGGGLVEPSAVLTNSDGRAGAWWTLGPSIADSQRVEARVQTAGSESLAAPVFSARATAGAPARIEGGGELANGGAGEAAPVELRVFDHHGNPVAGAEVVWTVVAGGGSVQPDRSVSGADGVARTAWTRGPYFGRENVLTARAASMNARWTTFVVPPDKPDRPVRLLTYYDICWWPGCINEEDWQVGAPGEQLPRPVQLYVRRERYTDGIPGTWVFLHRAGGGAPLDSALTDNDGVVVFRPVLGPQNGVQEFVARVPGLALEARIRTYASTETPILTAKITPISIGRSGDVRYVEVRVTTQTGAPIADYPVRATVTAGEGMIEERLRRSGPDGQTWFEWRYGSSAQEALLRAGPSQVRVAGSVGGWFIPDVAAGDTLWSGRSITVYTTTGPSPRRGPGHPDPGPPRTLFASVHGRTMSTPSASGDERNGYHWTLQHPTWLDGVPEGPAVVEIYFVGSGGSAEIPVIIHHRP